MRVLVTGGAGFIGSHLVRFLLNNGRARYSLNWTPDTDIKEGVIKMYEYFNN